MDISTATKLKESRIPVKFSGESLPFPLRRDYPLWILQIHNQVVLITQGSTSEFDGDDKVWVYLSDLNENDHPSPC